MSGDDMSIRDLDWLDVDDLFMSAEDKLSTIRREMRSEIRKATTKNRDKVNSQRAQSRKTRKKRG